jgi:AcrR family transcriptional regulator
MRRRSDEVRSRIVDVAYESFWRLGFRRSTVDSIAARAGLTKRTVYGYFRSKDDLLAAVLQRYDELAAQRLQRIGDACHQIATERSTPILRSWSDGRA